MCGIAGVFSPYGTSTEQWSNIARLTFALKHRGPDGQGLQTSADTHVVFGHRRLAILDLHKRADQPMAHPVADLLLVFNGEIFNFLELRKELSQLGHTFHTDSDTEVILAAWLSWGEAMQHRFNGMWAIALYDGRKKTLFLSRDRHGVKPLFYTRYQGLFYFASEVQALDAMMEAERPLDHRVVQELLMGGFAHYGTELTYVEGVRSLPPGHSITLEDDLERPVLRQWYQLNPVAVPDRFEDQVQVLRALIADACRLRLRTDVPLATCLSGGVDSCSIVGMLAGNDFADDRFAGQYDHTSFTASFPGQYNDEQDAAWRMTKAAGGQLEVIPILPPTGADVEHYMARTDGPMHAMAFYPIAKLYEGIRARGIKVTLDGIGPDEMMGGYRPVEAAFFSAVEMRDPGYFYDVYRTYAAQGESPVYSSRRHTRHIAGLVLRHLLFEQLGRLRKGAGRQLRRAGLLKPIGPMIQPMELPVVPGLEFVFQLPETGTTLERTFHRDFFQQTMQTILQQYDRASMNSGVESRMPFMDYRLVEYIFSLPLKSKVGGGYTKRVLREAIKGLVPDDIRLNKVKIGFNAPHEVWLKDSLREWALDMTRSEAFRSNPYFDAEAYTTLLDKHLGGEKLSAPDMWRLWPPLHLIFWMEHRKRQAGKLTAKTAWLPV
ncbi:asparagine synthase (glutamine-hydrolyzing) [Nostoc sp. NIES-2111]